MGRWTTRAFHEATKRVVGGTVRLDCPSGTFRFGEPSDLDLVVTVHNERFFRRVLAGADIGVGEAYVDGDWSTSDLVTVGRIMLRNRRMLDRKRGFAGVLATLRDTLARRLRDNTLSGSRRHIRRHYDLGNDFFRLFLDSRLLMYSAAYYESAGDSLETAQVRKVDRICRMLDLQPGDHVLEIGSGWGGFAAWAATRYGCRVTTTTISEQQYRHVSDWRRTAGEAGARVEVLRADYRELTGQFTKIVSIEMFEAVGLRHYDDFFGVVDRLLAPDGSMVLQTITVDDQWFPSYRGTPDWIEKYIFPGGELASLGEISKSLARATSLSMYTAENFGLHYARTLRDWRGRFHDRLAQVRALGFDDRFIRMWDYYLALCEATFLERHTGVFQMLLVKNGSGRRRFNEPWAEADARGTVAERESAA